ncbi:MAG: glycosyltransferase [Synergistaceae bacterium]|nr:glycosyltransferase [Synergistaceae bacterium]
MKVYYDYQMLFAQRYGGISRYFFEVVSRLPELGVDVEVSCLHSRNWYFRDMLGIRDYSKSNRIVRGLERRIFSRVNKLKALHEVRRGYDIIHPTYYDPYMLGGHSGKLVVTVYDMIHEKFGGDEPTIRNKKKMLHASDHIISISESTKRDVLEIYPDIRPEKISVIHLGNSMPKIESAGKNPLGTRYILFVGNRGWYKNFIRFVQAVRPILERHDDICVFCVGGGGYSYLESLKSSAA